MPWAHLTDVHLTDIQQSFMRHKIVNKHKLTSDKPEDRRPASNYAVIFDLISDKTKQVPRASQGIAMKKAERASSQQSHISRLQFRFIR